MGRGRRQGKTPTPPVEMEITLELFKYKNVKGDTVPKAGPLDPLKEPEGFLQQFLSENKDRPEIREYLDKIEKRRLQQRRIETDTQSGRGRDGEAKKRLAKKDQNFPANGISREETLKRRRERKAWKAMWAKIFPPVVRKTASKEKNIWKEMVPARAKMDDKAKNGLVSVRMRVYGGNPTVRDMENMTHLVEIVRDSEYVRNALNL